MAEQTTVFDFLDRVAGEPASKAQPSASSKARGDEPETNAHGKPERQIVARWLYPAQRRRWLAGGAA